MFKSILISSSILCAGVLGAASLSLAADVRPSASLGADYSASPVFPTAKERAAVLPDVAPSGAQYRVRSGKSGVTYIACSGETRAYPGGAVELRCLSFSKSKGWGKSLRWYPKYQLAGLNGPMPVEPVATASR